MQLLVILMIAFVIGYWLARSKYHEPIDRAAQQPKKWWNRLIHRSEAGKTTEKTTNSDEKQEA